MFRSASTLRAILLAAGAAAVLGAASPAMAGGYGEPDVIYADRNGYDGDFIGQRPLVRPAPTMRPAPVIEDYDVIPARAVAHQLREQGYGRVRDIALRGDIYRVTAVRNNGALFRIRVDAYSGEILSASRIGWVNGGPPRPLPRGHVKPGVSIEFGLSGN